MKIFSRTLFIIGTLLLAYAGFEHFSMQRAQEESYKTAVETIERTTAEYSIEQIEKLSLDFRPDYLDSFGLLEIPKLQKEISIIEGADEEALSAGVGHVASTAFPSQGKQIVLSGHRDTVFRDFGMLEIGDTFIVHMPFGEYEYEIRESEIVDADDTSVIGRHTEEVLVVSTCYPFDSISAAPDRYVLYAYPI